MPDIGIFNALSDFIELRMKSCRVTAYGSDWIEHKAHADYDLWFVEAGSVKIEIAGTEYRAGAGDVVFFYPQIPYKAASGEDGCRFIYVHFDYGIGGQQRILSDFRLSGIIKRELLQEEVALFGKSYNQSDAMNNKPGTRLYLKACLTAVIAKIIALHGQGQYTGTFLNGKKTKKSERNLDILQPIFQYVYDHLHQSMKMSELAALAGISEKYFISYFKKAVGITPGQYIYHIKMNQARDYLYQKKYSIQQISGLLGYPDPFTFSKAFKKYYNVPPSKFE
ncbi:AraC family transcriptional regulator [Paenibacillus harenae]|uniref:AraC family transcriptional regulator n=1 Tax=Paenibacillus harenae TaxID=306543 RepID=UPI002791E381|nr:AraC family transcriptional regulator [Paenibacillus harenae]MDQ0060234.1 AraC-like DNA-binding protein [Paenibacillus harenae]